jgi:uncharacterized OB-fold protein
VSLRVFVCESCGRAIFPQRFLCPDCGGREWRDEAVDAGTLEAAAEREVRVGAVRTSLGPLVIARIESAAEPGSEASLDQDGDTPIAR